MLQASPSNPTGALARDEDIQEIARWVRCARDVDRQRDLPRLEGAPQTALAQEEEIIVFITKYFHMSGWRLGWLAAPAHRMADDERLAQNLFLVPPTPAQFARWRPSPKKRGQFWVRGG